VRAGDRQSLACALADHGYPTSEVNRFPLKGTLAVADALRGRGRRSSNRGCTASSLFTLRAASHRSATTLRVSGRGCRLRLGRSGSRAQCTRAITLIVVNPMNRQMELRYLNLALAFALLLLAACAMQPSVQTNATDIVCDKVTPIDSPTPVPMCNEREE
jgi:hypothetical protein